MEKENRIKELVQTLNLMRAAYYGGETESPMSDAEYDLLYDELVSLEKQTGFVLPDSPTQTVGAEVTGKLPKVAHEVAAKSLDKTKDVALMEQSFVEGLKEAALDNKNVVVMHKLDGGTLVVTLERKGEKVVVKAATRGNGLVGQDVSHNAPFIEGIPSVLPPTVSKVVVRGEALMSYESFNRINHTLPEEARYKHPRNLATASVSLLEKGAIKDREIVFKAFTLVSIEGMEKPKLFFDQLDLLGSMGFDTVDFELVEAEKLTEALTRWTEKAKTYDYPLDGLVVAGNDTQFTASLPETSHHPNHMVGYALKWKDDTYETVLRQIEWSASRTGLLNPVAVFDPTEVDGTTITRATLHNVSYVKMHNLRVGDRISIFKANQVIPALYENLDEIAHEQLTDADFPCECPVCKGKVVIERTTAKKRETEVLRCTNPDCAAKQLGKFTHFVERDCMNIDGLSEETLEKFIDSGIVSEYADLFKLTEHKDRIVQMEGFGEKSFAKLNSAAQIARTCDFVSFLHSVGIDLIGKGQAAMLRDHLKEIYHSFGKVVEPFSYYGFLKELWENNYDFSQISGFGQTTSESLKKWCDTYLNADETTEGTKGEIARLLPLLRFSDPVPEVPKERGIFFGKTFVITGSLRYYKNREELVAEIESLGGHVAGSVSRKTDYLINNDVTSTSGKNKKAKELGIRIISENVYIAMKRK